jgi:hypothetical protein
MVSPSGSRQVSPWPSAQPGVGDEGTAIIPGTPWHVHDSLRPQPPVLVPGAAFSELAPPPGDATVLFDGKDLSQWEAADGGPF